MRRRNYTLVVLLAVLLAGAVALWQRPAKGLLRDAPRQLPWTVPDYRSASAAHSVLPDGSITYLSAAGMTVVPEVAGMRFGEIQHRFGATPTGTRYRVVSVIGVEWPSTFKVTSPHLGIYVMRSDAVE